MKVTLYTNVCLLFPCLLWATTVLFLGGQEIDSKMGEGLVDGRRNVYPPFFSLVLAFFPLSHIRFPHLLRLVIELCIGPRSLGGEDWYNINTMPRIIKQRA